MYLREFAVHCIINETEMDGPKRDLVLKLMEEKFKLELELEGLHEILKTYNADMSTPLVDNQGYPREDIDVYQVRHARHRIICLQNDLRDKFKQIENGLKDIHAECAVVDPIARRMASITTNVSPNHADSVPLNPFAVVTMVEQGSPADFAGLCKHDQIIQFGSLTHTNFSGLEAIYNIVSHSVGQPINVQLIRGSLVVGVTLVPKPWSNRGLLGCHIQKVQ